MASVSAFTDMMGQFLTELIKTFPEEKGLKKYMIKFELLKDTNPRKVVDKYMTNIAPYVDKLSNRDETIFTDESSDLDFVKAFDVKKCWPMASETTKNAIWQYLQTLYMLGVTIKSIPSDTLSMIENVAKQCAEKMQNSDEKIDETQLLQSMQSMLGGMVKK